MTPSEKAARGAAHLDALLPGWAGDIDVVKLDMESPGDDVVAQLRRQHEDVDEELAYNRDLGFDTIVASEYEALTEAWRAEVAARLEDVTPCG